MQDEDEFVNKKNVILTIEDIKSIIVESSDKKLTEDELNALVGVFTEYMGDALVDWLRIQVDDFLEDLKEE